MRRAGLFLDGRSDELTGELTAAMETASASLEFEEAARLRDLVASLRSMHSRQYVDGRAADLVTDGADADGTRHAQRRRPAIMRSIWS